VAAVAEDDEEGSIQELLGLVPRERQNVAPPEFFDARAADSRLSLLALASLKPRTLDEGRPLDVAQLIENDDVQAFSIIVSGGSSRPENRALYPADRKFPRELSARIQDRGVDDPVLASHAISAAAARAFDDTPDVFRGKRRATLEAAFQTMADRLAGWLRKDRDRPSMDYLPKKRKSKRL